MFRQRTFGEGWALSEIVPPSEAAQKATRSIAGAAGIIGAGNIVSRVLGLVRELVIADYFGASPFLSAFRVASQVPTMIFDLLIGGMLSSALIPVFSDYAENRKKELWELASVLFSLAAVILTALVILLELGAPVVAWLLGGGFEPEVLAMTTRLIRAVLPAVLVFGISGIAIGLLYSLQRFAYPAFGAAIYNLGLIISAVFLAVWLDVYALAVGILLGAIFQFGLLAPGLRDGHFRFSLNLKHPGLRRILKLYLPIVLGLVVSQIGIAIDRNLASRTGGESIAWMQYATNLVQFPLGLVAAAISLASLPSLARSDYAKDDAGYERTLGISLRMVLVLLVPATIGLFVLAQPVVALIFEHGAFGPQDTVQVANALRFYLFGLTFAGIDQLLIFAFYARKNTLTPALVGVAAVGIYLIVALALIRPLGMIGLVIANSCQLAGHAIIMLFLLRKSLGHSRLGGTVLKSLAAAGGMGLAVYWSAAQAARFAGNESFTGWLLQVGAGGALGILVYAVLISRLKVDEWALFSGAVRRRLRLTRHNR
jgi:putative peptidoglycan lipid II flippase